MMTATAGCCSLLLTASCCLGRSSAGGTALRSRSQHQKCNSSATRAGSVRCQAAKASHAAIKAEEAVLRREVLGGALLAFVAASAPALAVTQQCSEVKDSATGLTYCDTVEGSGSQAKSGTLIKAHYTGKLLNGTVFDSSYNRGKPFSFKVGAGQVIQGWDIGILGNDSIPPMRQGGKRTLRIPSELAYGARGAGCRGGKCLIPPNSDLIFDVEYLGTAY
eukprot:jgi/Chlat1/2644/Chrsp178S02482